MSEEALQPRAGALSHRDFWVWRTAPQCRWPRRVGAQQAELQVPGVRAGPVGCALTTSCVGLLPGLWSRRPSRGHSLHAFVLAQSPQSHGACGPEVLPRNPCTQSTQQGLQPELLSSALPVYLVQSLGIRPCRGPSEPGCHPEPIIGGGQTCCRLMLNRRTCHTGATGRTGWAHSREAQPRLQGCSGDAAGGWMQQVECVCT